MRKIAVLFLCLMVLMPVVLVSAGCDPNEDPNRIGIPEPEPTPKKKATFKTHVKIHYHFASLVGEWWRKPNQYFYFSDVSIVVFSAGNFGNHLDILLFKACQGALEVGVFLR